jgi:hypothetical protein
MGGQTNPVARHSQLIPCIGSAFVLSESSNTHDHLELISGNSRAVAQIATSRRATPITARIFLSIIRFANHLLNKMLTLACTAR